MQIRNRTKQCQNYCYAQKRIYSEIEKWRLFFSSFERCFKTHKDAYKRFRLR